MVESHPALSRFSDVVQAQRRVRLGMVLSEALGAARIALGVFAATCQTLSAQPPTFPENPLAGQKLFVEKGCVSCHAIMGMGGRVGSDLAKTQANRSPAGIVAMMWNHSPEMTEALQKRQQMSTFTEEDMAALIAYIYYLNYFDQPGDAREGARVLEQKKCLMCHQVAGKGGAIGPPLDRVKQHASALHLAQTMWNHGIGMTRTFERMGIARPQFEGSELVDLFAYLRSLSRWKSASNVYLRPGSPREGERLFESKGCLRCHQIGSPGRAGRGQAVGPDLTRRNFHVGVTQIASRLWNHGPAIWKKMQQMNIEPPTFEDNELADVAAYLYFLAFITETGDAASGQVLFTKKGCSGCHSVRGRGGSAAPDLAESRQTSNYIKAATAMWNHNRTMLRMMAEAGMAVPRFSEREMMDLLAYLRSQRGAQ